MGKKQKFLKEHNDLSSPDLQANISMLSRFKIEKSSLFRKNDWSMDKIRRPFILWLTSLTKKEKEKYLEED